MMIPQHSPSAGDTAILFAAGTDDPDVDRGLGLPAFMLPVLGKSMLQRAVERLILHGCREIRVVLGDHAAGVRAFLQEGERWGCRISYHYLGPMETLGRFAHSVGVSASSHCWLADAARVPDEELPGGELTPAAGYPLCWHEALACRWTGWGQFSGAWLLAQDRPFQRASFERQLLRDTSLRPLEVERPLSANSPADLLASARRLLEANPDPRPALGRGARIHRSAQLVAPVHIGDNVKIGAGAVIGPHVAVESGAYVDKGTHVRDSIVMPNTYVGEELDLTGAIVHGGALVNTALDAITECRDPRLLAELHQPDTSSALAQRLTSLALRITLLPLYGLARWRTRQLAAAAPVTIPRPRRDRVEPGQMRVALDLPNAAADSGSTRWARHFCRTFYPGLRLVGRGDLELVGPSLRSIVEVGRLSPEWQRIYCEARCGLLNDALLLDAASQCAEDQFASDAVAAVSQGVRRTALRFLGIYLGHVLREVCGAHGTGRASEAAT